MIGDHTCLSESSCRLQGHRFTRPHTARTSQFSVKQAHEPMLLLRSTRNVYRLSTVYKPYSAGNGGFTFAALLAFLSDRITTYTYSFELSVHGKVTNTVYRH